MNSQMFPNVIIGKYSMQNPTWCIWEWFILMSRIMNRWAQAQTLCFSAKKARSSITHQLLLMIEATEKHLIQCFSHPALKPRTTPCASMFAEF